MAAGRIVCPSFPHLLSPGAGLEGLRGCSIYHSYTLHPELWSRRRKSGGLVGLNSLCHPPLSLSLLPQPPFRPSWWPTAEYGSHKARVSRLDLLSCTQRGAETLGESGQAHAGSESMSALSVRISDLKGSPPASGLGMGKGTDPRKTTSARPEPSWCHALARPQSPLSG